MYRKPSKLNAVVCCAMWAVLLGAQDTEPQRLSNVVVTASPIIEGQNLNRLAQQTTIVTQEQIDDLNAQDVLSALRRTPGVVISRYNMIGSHGGGEGGGFFLRGMGSSRPGGEIQTLLDGVPIQNPIWNHPLMDLMSVDAIEAIEVHKSAQPSEFGNAFGAVNIVPKRRMDPGLEGKFSLAYGEEETFIQRLETGGRQGKFDFYLGQSYRESNGHRAESDGALQSYYLRLGFMPAEHWDLGLMMTATDNYAQDPGPEGNIAARNGTYETSNWLGVLSLSHRYPNVEGSVKLYSTRGNGDWIGQAGAADDTLNDWTVYGARLRELVRPWEGGEVTMGLDVDNITGEAKFTRDAGATTYFEETTWSLVSPYCSVSHSWQVEGGLVLTPSVGIRGYEHDEFDSEIAPHAGVVAAYGPITLHAAYARGIVYPGLNVVAFSENVLATLGQSWKDLEAEKLHHWEIGVSYEIGTKAVIDLTTFYDDGEDRYVFYRPGGGGPPNTWENIETFRIRGVELSLTAFPAETLSLFAGVTCLSTDPTDLPYAPDWTVSTGLKWQASSSLSLSVDAQYVGDMAVASQARRKDALNGVEIAGYLVVNAKAGWDFPVSNKVSGTLFLALENIADEDYEYQPGYPMPGLSVMGGMELSF